MATINSPGDERRIREEQLRLVLGNVGNILLPSAILAILLVWALGNASNSRLLTSWAASMLLFRVLEAVHARIRLRTNRWLSAPDRLLIELAVLNFVDGTIWGSLAWIILGKASVADSILVIATFAAIVGSSMSRLSPLLPIFLSLVTPMLLMVSIRVWFLGESSYQAFSLGILVFLGGLILIGRNSAREVRRSIELRFENVSLIDQLKSKTDLAESAMREAEQANAQKSKFLAAASHDLRQPIHAQGLFLEALARTELDERQRGLLVSARAASEASSELLSALLDFSRIEAGVIKPQDETFPLQPLLTKIENELAPQADAKNIVYRSRETSLAVRTDSMLLELILRNLVSNAIRYTDTGGVLLGCRVRGDQACVEVWDTGIGIAPEHRQDIFREFHQLGNPERDRRKGLGLGLAIVDGLIRAMGLTLSMTSVPGSGSVFRIQIPLAKFADVRRDGTTTGKPSLLQARILVVDDDEAIRSAMLHLLLDWGCDCEAVESIEDALTSARRHRPDVVICDYRLRDKRTGAEAISELRALIGDSLPALLITGDTAPERLREAQACGVPLLHKPVSPAKLYKQLAELREAETARA